MRDRGIGVLLVSLVLSACTNVHDDSMPRVRQSTSR
jgi:hypothetical protein